MEHPDEPQPWVEDFSANSRLYRGYVGVIIGIIEKKMETTIVYWNIWNSCKDAQGRVPDTGTTGHEVQLIDFGFLSPGVTQHSGHEVEPQVASKLCVNRGHAKTVIPKIVHGTCNRASIMNQLHSSSETKRSRASIMSISCTALQNQNAAGPAS